MSCLRCAARISLLIACLTLVLQAGLPSLRAQTENPSSPQPLDQQTLEDLESELLGEDSEFLEEELDDEDDSPRRNGLGRFFPRWRAAGDVHERNHRSVREAFREPVREASQATVQVYADGERVSFGTIVHASGIVFTKASELRGDLACRFRDGKQVKAHLTGVRDDMDLAILRIEADNLPVAPWRESPAPTEGSWLATAGTQAIPTAVGVVSVAPRAIPTPQAVLGVMLENANLGPRITGVIEDSAAEEAGMLADDIITDLNGLPMPNRETLIEAIQKKRPGDRVEMTVLRADQRVTIHAKLQERNRMLQGKRIDFQNSLGGKLSDRRWGFPSVIQHDTVLRPHECGGPVVDLDGRVVGINIARAGRVASYALPVEVLQPVLKEITSAKQSTWLVDARADVPNQVEYLREAVRQWKQRCADLQEQLDAARRGADSAQPVSDRNSTGMDVATSDAGQGAGGAAQAADLIGIVRLELATESAQAELTKALAALEKLEGTRADAPAEAE